MLAALAHGVSSSIGWLDGAGRAEAKRLLGVPDKRLLRTILALGYPVEGTAPRRGTRKPLEEIVHLERYR